MLAAAQGLQKLWLLEREALQRNWQHEPCGGPALTCLQEAAQLQHEQQELAGQQLAAQQEAAACRESSQAAEQAKAAAAQSLQV